MGQLTRDTIVSEGLQLMGRPDLTARAQVWLNSFLGSVYAKFDWPFLNQRSGLLALAAGATSVTFGDGTLVTDKVQSIKKIFIGDATNNGMKREVTVVSPDGVEAGNDPLWADTNARGVPTMFLVEPVSSNANQWTLKPYPIPDKAYRLIVSYKRVPAHLAANAVPLYPNDETLIQAVFVAALKHQQDERFAIEDGRLAQMIREDRVTWGNMSGSNQKLKLGKSFANRARSTNWMGD